MKRLFLLLALVPAVFFGKAQNLITDGDFSTSASIIHFEGGEELPYIWFSSINYPTEAYAFIEDGVCVFQVITGGADTWEPQLMQWGVPITAGHYYRFSFDVMADYDTYFGVFLGENWGSWTSLIGYENYYQYTTTYWTTITIPFYAPVAFDSHKVSFEFGNQYYNTFRLDNVVLEDLGTMAPIGIIGTAVNGWDTDVDMLTTDGITYTLSDFPLLNEELKFRQNDSWTVNWGSTDFPSGTGYQDGPNIPVYNTGNYDITFNRETGEYSFECVNNCLPVISLAGTAVPPGYTDEGYLQMRSSDGTNYILRNVDLADGEALFTQDYDPAINWGNGTFPTGTAVANGDPIPVEAGTWNVLFNLVTGEYSFEPPVVSMIGPAISDWDTDVDMQTADNIIYTFTNRHFIYGEVKFRQNHEWRINWGGYDFPAGWGWNDGPNIWVWEGNYDVVFNRLTGQYSFTAVDCPDPWIQCPDYIYVAADPGTCGATVYFNDPVPAPNCGGAGITITQTSGLPGGSFFPQGYNYIEYQITNETGATNYCSFYVYVYDTDYPEITGPDEPIDPLWPPNHQMVPVYLDYQVTDLCSATQSDVWVYSTEPESGLWDGDLFPDIEVIDNHNVLLRAERAGEGPGRQYYIMIYAWDESYNITFSEVVVTVPHDNGKYKSEIVRTGSAANLLIWPNPSRDAFNMKAPAAGGGIMDVYVTDLLGNTVLTLRLSYAETLTFGEFLRPGVYFLRTIQGNKQESYKVVKQ